MEIRKTKPEELEVLLKMYEHARTFMATHGNASQWGNTYPSPQLILDDITEGNSYVCTEQDQIIATFYYKEGADLRVPRCFDQLHLLHLQSDHRRFFASFSSTAFTVS